MPLLLNRVLTYEFHVQCDVISLQSRINDSVMIVLIISLISTWHSV